MARSLTIPRFGVGGRNTDKPSWALRPDELNDGSQDGVVFEGAMRRRRGVKVATNTGSSALGEIGRYTFVLAGRTYTLSSFFFGGTTSTNYWIPLNLSTGQTQPPSDTGLSSSIVIPRAVYRDEAIFCSQGGLIPVYRYSGALSPTVAVAGVTVAGNSTITATVTDLNVPVGQYVRLGRQTVGTVSNPLMHARVISATTTTVTVEDMRATLVQTMANANSLASGRTAPVVAIYNSGTVSIVAATSVATGAGTRWESALSNENDFATHRPPFGMLVNNAGTYHSYGVDDQVVPTDTSLRVYGADVTNLNYSLTSRCPFIDVCVHNERLYGAGVAQFPSRVYVAPAGWDMAYPPGATMPFDPTVEFTSTNPADFLLDFIDVPTPYDSDGIVAILATPGPRIVLKNKATYRLDGEPPYLQPSLMVADGCIDIRSAISVPEGAFWAGREGVYHYTGGTYPRNIMAGWMQHEWRALVQAGVATCTLGTDGRNLIVSIITADAANQKRTYCYDLTLERWLPELSNIHPRHIFTTRIADEITQMLAVDDAYSGKLLNIRPALDLTGPARDEVGTGPSFKLVTGDGLIGNDGIEGESRVLEVDVHASIRDPAGTTTLAVTATHGGSLRGDGAQFYDAANWDTGFYWGPDGSRALGNLTQDTDDTAARKEFQVNRLGRRMGLTIEETTTSSTVEQVELDEVVVRMRDTRRGT